MRIHDRQPRQQIEAYETQFYRPTPSGRRRRLGAPWLPLRTSLRCLPPKRYELCCGVYTPMLYGYAAVSTHQCSTDTLRCLHTNALRIRCGVYTPMLYGYAAVSTHQSATKYAVVFHTKALLLYMLRCSRTKATNYAAVSTPKLRDAEISIISIEADVVRRSLLLLRRSIAAGGVYDSAEGC